jgi:SpoU rRNA methylase family enzyme
MSAAPKGKSVIVQQAIDEAIYFVDGEVTYEAVPAENEEGDAVKFTVFVCFTPSNGHNKGQFHRVPISRVISVIGADPA